MSDNYDMILYNQYIKPSDNTNNKFKCNVMRLNNCINRNYLKIPNIIVSNIKFIDIKVSYNDKQYNIDFALDNYYIVGNILFDRPFIKWYINKYHFITIDDSDEYICHILDNTVNFIQIDASCRICIDKDGYCIEKYSEHEEIDETEL